MSLLNKYILHHIWVPMVFAAVVIAFIVVAGGIQDEVEQLVESVPMVRINLGDIGRMSVYLLPQLIGYIFPVTFLMGIMLAFGRMAQNSEIIAMKAAGIPLKRLVTPVIGAGVLLSILCFLIQNQAQPWAYRKLSRLVTADLPLRVSLAALPKGVMHDYGDWRVYIGDKDPDGVFHDVAVLQPMENGQVAAYYADNARFIKQGQGARLEMNACFFIPPHAAQAISHFKSLSLIVPPPPTREPFSERGGLSLGALLKAHREETAKYKENASAASAREVLKQRIEISERLSFPLMCLAVSIVAAPIGARTKKAGRSYAFASGFIIVTLYFVLRKVFEPPIPLPLMVTIFLGQLPNLMLCITGMFLIFRVDRV